MINISTLKKDQIVLVELVETHHWIADEPESYPLRGKFRAVVLEEVEDDYTEGDEQVISIGAIDTAEGCYIAVSDLDPRYGFVSIEVINE